MQRQYIVFTFFVLCLSASLMYGQAPYAAYDSYQRANSRYKKGDLDGAISEFTRAIELSSQLNDSDRKKDLKDPAFSFDRVRVVDPLAAQAYASRGLMRYLKRDYDEAIDDCNRAIELNPRQAEAYNFRGISYYAKKELEPALSDLNRSLAINPRSAQAYNNRGNIHAEMGNFEKAVPDFNQAIKLDSQLIEA